MVDFPLKQHKKEISGVPLGLHEAENWDEQKAVQLVRRAAMHYYKNIFESGKAGSYEALSNVPTWIMSVQHPTAGILTAAAGGTALTVSFAAESVVNALRFNRVLGILEEFETDRKNPETRTKAAKKLERSMHGEGLLFEGIPEYDLHYYPAEKFNSMMDSRRLFTEKGELKKRINNVGTYLRDNPKNAAIRVAAAPFELVEGGLNLSADILGAAFDVVKNGATNILRPSYLKNIYNGAVSLIKLPLDYKIWQNRPRNQVQQKSYYSQIIAADPNDDPDIEEKIITQEDRDELMKTREDLRQNIMMQKAEAGRYLAEGTFMGGHVMEALHHFNAHSLSNGDFTEGDIKFLTSAGSLLLAWEPFAHIGKNFKNLQEIGSGHRATEIQKYEKQSRQIQKALDDIQKQKEALNIEPSKDDKPKTDHFDPQI